MPKPITVLVAGATGHQGGAVARLLLDRGHTVRALTRKPQSPAAERLRELGAEVMAADLEVFESVERAAEGADAFFLVTPIDRGPEAELRAGRWAAYAARDAGVKHIIYSSVAGTDWITGVPHFDSKRQVELYLQDLGVPFTIVAPAFFMENLLGPTLLAGVRAGRLSMPLPSGRKLQMVAVDDIAGLVRLAIERRSEFAGKRIEIASDELTGPEIATALSRASGLPVAYAQGSLARLRAQNEELARTWEWLDRVGYDIDIDALRLEHPEVGWHTLAAWAQGRSWRPMEEVGLEQAPA
jgi:uncharacterized protein YbjT (DUF2867 family)